MSTVLMPLVSRHICDPFAAAGTQLPSRKPASPPAAANIFTAFVTSARPPIAPEASLDECPVDRDSRELGGVVTTLAPKPIRDPRSLLSISDVVAGGPVYHPDLVPAGRRAHDQQIGDLPLQVTLFGDTERRWASHGRRSPESSSPPTLAAALSTRGVIRCRPGSLLSVRSTGFRSRRWRSRVSGRGFPVGCR